MTNTPLDAIETGTFSSRNTTYEPRELIRIVTWNVARGYRLDAITEFLRSTPSDVICLQECDRDARRTTRTNVASEIARAVGMDYVFGVEFEELAEGWAGSPAYHGQATLSRFPISSSRILRFRNQSRFWRPYRWIPNLPKLERRLGGRMALVSRVQIAGKTLAVYNLHLESRSERIRHAQLAELFEDTRRVDPSTAVLVAGDFNFDLAEPAAASVVSDMRFHNPFKHERQRTTPNKHFGRPVAIDWILFKGPLKEVTARVHSSVLGSDHFPLSLTLRLA